MYNNWNGSYQTESKYMINKQKGTQIALKMPLHCNMKQGVSANLTVP